MISISLRWKRVMWRRTVQLVARPGVFRVTVGEMDIALVR